MKAYHIILLTQCYIKLTEKLTLEESIKYHDKNVVQKAQTLGLQLKGALYADAIWRTSEFLWNKFTKKEENACLWFESSSKRNINISYLCNKYISLTPLK